MKTFRADLHVHTVLSPCAGVEMIPPLIVEAALDHGLDIIAICDHNATANIAAVQKAADNTNLTVLPGMELQTKEEVHCLCLFHTLEQAFEFQEIVDAALPGLENNPDFFGEQFIVDETGDFIAREQRMLSTSTSLTLEAAWEKVTQTGGVMIPAHVDRSAFGLISNLGIIPPEIPFRILEISRFLTVEQAISKYRQLQNYTLFQNGDVHYLSDFLGSMYFTMQNPTLTEILLASIPEKSIRLGYKYELK